MSERSFARVPRGYLAWDSAERLLLSFSAEGKPLGSWPLDAAEVWLGTAGVLAREARLDADKGSRFVLYGVSLDDAPRQTWEGWVDCQVGDVLIHARGRALLAGEFKGGRTHRVWELGKKGEARVLLEIGSWNDSLRLIDAGGEIIAFASSKLREKRPFRLYGFRPGSSREFTELAVAAMPPRALCASGFGFSLRGEPILPVAMADGDYALVRLRRQTGALMPASVTPRAGHVLRALGTDEAGGIAFFLATDPLSSSRGLLLARYNGVDASLETVR